MPAGEPGTRGVAAAAGADVPMAVGGHRDPDAGAADQHPSLRAAVVEGRRHGIGKIGVVDGSAVMSPQIERDKAEPLELFDQQLLEVESGMIAGDGDGLGHGGGRSPWLFTSEELPYVDTGQQPATSHGSCNI